MVDVIFSPHYEKSFRKIRDSAFKEKLMKQVSKIRENPEIGKPMRYDRKGTRELYTPLIAFLILGFLKKTCLFS